MTSNQPRRNSTPQSASSPTPDREMIKAIHKLNQDKKNGTLKDYPIRDLVKHAEMFGPYLKNRGLETNQIRKFLDAINRLKAKLAQTEENQNQLFAEIEPEIVLLKPKLAYAAARQEAAKPLSDVMSAAIDHVHSLEDFERLVQLIESIIAYHKAEGGK
ncbi:type III-A CRISPR-associated protein Csm2 [Limnospira fusiformis]|uniref:CRISPR system Cms protein Csm2 n=1 Tax=Limnospira fusiformis PMC 851.14 TaxID=2219512 RepID=A0ABU9EIE3_LIMFS|nr:type III-A CRISPR-associated protein Csm2 [Limnospira fusiformis LS22]